MTGFANLASVDCQDCDWSRRTFPENPYMLVLAAREHTTKTDGHLVVFTEAAS